MEPEPQKRYTRRKGKLGGFLEWFPSLETWALRQGLFSVAALGELEVRLVGPLLREFVQDQFGFMFKKY